jgi:hypothetical protein
MKELWDILGIYLFLLCLSISGYSILTALKGREMAYYIGGMIVVSVVMAVRSARL